MGAAAGACWVLLARGPRPYRGALELIGRAVPEAKRFGRGAADSGRVQRHRSLDASAAVAARTDPKLPKLRCVWIGVVAERPAGVPPFILASVACGRSQRSMCSGVIAQNSPPEKVPDRPAAGSRLAQRHTVDLD